MTFIDESLAEKKRVNLSLLKNKLLTLSIENEGVLFAFFCSFDYKESILDLIILNKNTKEQKEFIQTGFIIA